MSKSCEQSYPEFVPALHPEYFSNSCEQSSPELDRIPPAKHPEYFSKPIHVKYEGVYIECPNI